MSKGGQQEAAWEPRWPEGRDMSVKRESVRRAKEPEAGDGDNTGTRKERSTGIPEERPGPECCLGPGRASSPCAEGIGGQLPPKRTTNHQAQGPQNASRPLPSTLHSLCSPQGSAHWRKTGKPTKIFQIGQICGADKSRTGWDEVSVAPRWGGPIKSGLRLQKNASSQLSVGAFCPSDPQKVPELGVPRLRNWGLSLASRAPTHPLPAPRQVTQAFWNPDALAGVWRAVVSCPLVVVAGPPCV